ncbi:DnaJ domain [Musa troglodytarum]|uniref:DnaJ domain n=1 Tax=Musa troglodytarum TaxID=320322 RepID=A0A9E7FAW6_9LILI|nr:DnaJ domain [Musa troglodytarum]
MVETIDPNIYIKPLFGLFPDRCSFGSLFLNKKTKKMSAALPVAGMSLHGAGRHRMVMAEKGAPAAAGTRGRSPYEVLRVRETATAGEIKAAYRSMAKRFHPDVTADGRVDDFVEIHRAYEALSDPVARARYDLLMGRWWRGAEHLRSRRWETDQCW